MCIIYFGILDNTFSFHIGSSDWHHEVFLPHRKTHLWSPGLLCPLAIKIFCWTNTLMLVRRQFATYVFALHAPVRSSATILQAPHHQPPRDENLVADQSCTPTQHTVRCKWEACVHSSSSGRLCLCMENLFSQQDK